MDDFDFTDEEILEQLKNLGYHNVPPQRLQEFKQDLAALVRHERSKNSSWASTQESDTHTEGPDLVPLTILPSKYGPSKATYRPSHNDAVHPVPITQPVHPVLSEPCLNSSLESTTSTERRVMKRKVLRKVDGGQKQVFDESSVTESDMDDVSSLELRLRNLPVTIDNRPRTAPPERPARAHSAMETPCYRLPDDYSGPTALIKPMKKLPNEVRKSDPVSRYQTYSRSWQSQRAPGERSHKQLRWNVKEQMMYHDVVVDKKPSKVNAPNSYVIPSDKKRKNLRWQIRNDLAQGVKPPSAFD